jgi:hypothetical protein
MLVVTRHGHLPRLELTTSLSDILIPSQTGDIKLTACMAVVCGNYMKRNISIGVATDAPYKYLHNHRSHTWNCKSLTRSIEIAQLQGTLWSFRMSKEIPF